MSISSTVGRNDAVGNGVTVTWPYTFKIFDKSQITVLIYSSVTRLEQTLILDVDYTVAGVGAGAGGSITQILGITVPVVLPATSTITIKRNVPLTQTSTLQNQGAFLPKTIEDALDRGIMIEQQQQDVITAAIHLPSSEVHTSANTLLPTIANRAGKLLGFDSSGNLVATINSITSSLVSSFWNPILALATAAASRSALGNKEVVVASDTGVSPNHVLSNASIVAAGYIPPTSYVDGALYSFKAEFSSLASGTLNVNGLGAKGIWQKGADPATGGAVYNAMSLRQYSAGEHIVVAYDSANDKFVIVSSLYSQDSMVSYGVSGASAGTTYDTASGIKRVNTAITGNIFSFKADVANTGACTLNVNSTGAKPLKVQIFNVLQDPPAGFITAGDILQVVYDGTNYVIMQDSSVRKLVSVTSLAAVATTGSIALVSGFRYEIEFDLTQNTVNGVYTLRFNADAGANYKWVGHVYNSSPANAAYGVNGATAINLLGSAELATFPNAANGMITLSPDRASTSNMYAQTRSAYRANAGNDLTMLNGTGLYLGGAAVTSFAILTSAGTFTGKVKVYQMPTP